MKDTKIDKRFITGIKTTPVSCTDFKHRKEIKLPGLVLRKEHFVRKDVFVGATYKSFSYTRHYVHKLPQKYFAVDKKLNHKASVRIFYASGCVCTRHFETDSDAAEYARYISDCIKDAGNSF